jgi:hypothetical protein
VNRWVREWAWRRAEHWDYYAVGPFPRLLVRSNGPNTTLSTSQTEARSTTTSSAQVHGTHPSTSSAFDHTKEDLCTNLIPHLELEHYDLSLPTASQYCHLTIQSKKILHNLSTSEQSKWISIAYQILWDSKSRKQYNEQGGDGDNRTITLLQTLQTFNTLVTVQHRIQTFTKLIFNRHFSELLLTSLR